jgi:hypothetical protein
MNKMTNEVAAAILGISVDATKAEIDSAWKARARLVHPDRFEAGSKSQDTATESMKQLNSAKEAMIDNLGKPQTQPSSNSQPSNDSSNQKPQQETKQEPQYRPMTLEEQEEQRKAFRRGQVEEEKAYIKLVFKSFAIYGSVFLITAASSLISGYSWIMAGSNDKMTPLAFLIVSVVASGFLWNKVAVRVNAIVESTNKITAIHSVSRSEQKEYNRLTRRTRKN